MKKRLILAAAIVSLLFAALLFLAVFDPYIVWFHIISRVKMTVDGTQEKGWVHRGNRGRTFFVTHVTGDRKETYRVFLREKDHALIVWCGDWSAPHFPVFAIGDVSPPCWGVVIEEGKPIKATPARHLVAEDNFLEFTLNDGRRLRAAW